MPHHVAESEQAEIDVPDATARDEQTLRILVFLSGNHSSDELLAIERYIDVLAAEPCIDPSILLPHKSPLFRSLADRGMRVYPLSEFARSLLQRAPQLWPILTAMRRFHFDIALTHDAFAARGLRFCADRVIGVAHHGDFDRFCDLDDLILLSSGACEDAAGELDGIRLHTLPHPYDCQFDRIKPLPDNLETLTIGTALDLVAQNGLGVFLHMAQLVHQAYGEVKFVLAGQGPMEHDLKELADQIAPFVEFRDHLSHQEMVEQFDLFCQTSQEASFSMALCRMMDAGIACVSTCCQGPMDILKGGMVAPLVTINDAFQMTEKIIELIENRPMLEGIKKAGFERIREEDFATAVFEDRLLDLIFQRTDRAVASTSQLLKV